MHLFWAEYILNVCHEMYQYPVSKQISMKTISSESFALFKKYDKDDYVLVVDMYKMVFLLKNIIHINLY